MRRRAARIERAMQAAMHMGREPLVLVRTLTLTRWGGSWARHPACC